MTKKLKKKTKISFTVLSDDGKEVLKQGTIDDFIKELHDERDKLPWYFKLWYWYIKRILDKIESEVRSWPFRLKNGFDYRDTWSLDSSIARFVLPRLRHLRDNNHGHPCDLTDKKWIKIQNKMIKSFELILQDFQFIDMKTHKKEQKQIQEGLQLFAKYFQNLWD